MNTSKVSKELKAIALLIANKEGGLDKNDSLNDDIQETVAAATFKCPSCDSKVLENTGYCLSCKKKVKKSFVLTAARTEYTKYFEKKLDKYKVDSPSQLSNADKKKFFDEVDKDWTSQDEKKKESAERCGVCKESMIDSVCSTCNSVKKKASVVVAAKIPKAKMDKTTKRIYAIGDETLKNFKECYKKINKIRQEDEYIERRYGDNIDDSYQNSMRKQNYAFGNIVFMMSINEDKYPELEKMHKSFNQSMKRDLEELRSILIRDIERTLKAKNKNTMFGPFIFKNPDDGMEMELDLEKAVETLATRSITPIALGYTDSNSRRVYKAKGLKDLYAIVKKEMNNQSRY